MNPSTVPVTQTPNEVTITHIRKRLVQILSVIALVRFFFPGIAYGVLVYDIPASNIYLGSFLIIVLMTLWFVLATLNRVDLAAFGLVLTLIALAFGVDSLERFQPYIAIVAVSTLVRDWRAFSALSVFIFGLTTWQIVTGVPSTGTPAVEPLLRQMGLVVAMATAAITIRYFVNSIQQTVLTTERDASLLRIAAEVGQITVGDDKIDKLLGRVVHFLQNRFGYEHVQVFLVDEQDDVAWLRASTGELGQQLLARQHHRTVGSDNAIGQVAQTGDIATVTRSALPGTNTDMVAEANAQLVLPIRDGERTVGVLDVHSAERGGLPLGDIQALQVVANLLATAIHNAALFEEQRRIVQENQRLYIEAESRLRDINRLNRRLTRESWQRFTAEQGAGTGIVMQRNQSQRTSEWSELQNRARESRKPVFDNQNGRHTVAVPIILRSQVIGAIELEPDPDINEADAREIARAVSERLAVSLDNARLFEESRETTLYEQQVNRIVSSYQNVNSVERLLQVTLEELGESLGATGGAIRLSTAQFGDAANPPGTSASEVSTES